MTLIEQLVTAAMSGQRPRFADLPDVARIELTDTLVPHGRPFTEAERALFEPFALELDPWHAELVAEFNASGTGNVAPMILQQSGAYALPAKLLTWCGPGDGFHAIQQVLWQCGIVPNDPVPAPNPFA